MNEVESKYGAIAESLGFIGPRVTPEMVKELVEGVTYSTHIVPGTTTTIAVAFAASGYPLCSAVHPCPSPENFNPALSIEIAIAKAKGAAWERLRELEEYRLAQALHEAGAGSATKALEQIRAVLSRASSVAGECTGQRLPCPCGSHAEG